MFRRIPALLIVGAFSALTILPAPGQGLAPVPNERPDVRIAATVSTKPLATGAARAIKEQKGLLVTVAAGLTSADALDALAQDQADIALLTRQLTIRDRAEYPDLDLVTVPIGMQVVALGISNDLWTAGLRVVTPEQMRGIYEQKITNWKDVGGPDEKITLFTFEQGAGIWEIFATWLYVDNRKAPLPKVEAVATSEDARDDLEFTPGAIAPLGATFVDDARCHALGIRCSDHVGRPTPMEVAANRYPAVRPIIAVIVGRPALAIRTVTEYLTGPAGQALVRSTGALGVDAFPKPSPTPTR
jgi:phosphate transport system substrate-binding protein